MALTENFTFKLGDTGVILNTNSTGFPFVDITRITGLDNSPFRETIRDHEGADGGFLDAEFEKGREIVLEGTAYATPGTLDTYLDTLKDNYSPVQAPIPFYVLSDGSTSERLLFVKSRGVRYDYSASRRNGTEAIKFGLYAEDPRIYSSSLQSVNIPFGAVSFTGFGFSIGFSFGFGGTSGTTDGTIVSNGGNRPAPVLFTITGPVVDPQIVNDAVGLTMRFSPLTLASTDTLVVDTANKTVTLNGFANRRSTLQDPNWFLLQKGDNFIRFRGASGSAPAALNIQWRSAWR